jgi:hypothetical protein
LIPDSAAIVPATSPAIPPPITRSSDRRFI